MTRTHHQKSYPTSGQARRAWQHWNWFDDLTRTLDTDLTVPPARHHGPTLITGYVNGRHPRPGDLPLIAERLGHLHQAVAERIGQWPLNQPHVTRDGLVISDFVTPRQDHLDPADLPTEAGPVAVYKDANVRNFLITDNAGVVMVDFDDLTVAPVGYDLAKLVVSAAMTYGPTIHDPTLDVLAAYNRQL